MSKSEVKIDYATLLEANELIRRSSDECYWLMTTRTVQESKLFPVPPYVWLAWLNCYYGYPELVRKIEAKISAEECGDRARNSSLKLSTLNTVCCLLQFYLLGREHLIGIGLIKPEDGAQDLIDLVSFWKRFVLAYRRNDAHLLNKDAGDRSQPLPERTLQVFEADYFEVTPGDDLHKAAVRLAANLAQYTFLSHCECRIGIHNSGPYRVGEHELLIRDWYDLGEGDLPWLDGIAGEIPYSNLTMPMFMKDTHFNIVDGYGSFESTPEYDTNNLIGVGLYTSDVLSEGYLPVGMNSREELHDTMQDLSDKLEEATTKLWQLIAGWSRDEMMDAGALVYYAANKELAHIAGVYDPADWFTLDERVQRFRPMLNDEYARDAMGELVLANYAHQQSSEYVMPRFSEAAHYMITTVPYSVLSETTDFAPTMGPFRPAGAAVPDKTGKYTTTRGKLDLDEYNKACADFRPKAVSEPFRYLDEEWVKHNYDQPLADELYALAQETSRNLAGKGASLRRADIAAIREKHAD